MSFLNFFQSPPEVDSSVRPLSPPVEDLRPCENDSGGNYHLGASLHDVSREYDESNSFWESLKSKNYLWGQQCHDFRFHSRTVIDQGAESGDQLE